MVLPKAYQKLAGPGGLAAHARFCRTNAGTDIAEPQRPDSGAAPLRALRGLQQDDA
jgi:hypothetical protein